MCDWRAGSVVTRNLDKREFMPVTPQVNSKTLNDVKKFFPQENINKLLASTPSKRNVTGLYIEVILSWSQCHAGMKRVK